MIKASIRNKINEIPLKQFPDKILFKKSDGLISMYVPKNKETNATVAKKPIILPVFLSFCRKIHGPVKTLRINDVTFHK